MHCNVAADCVGSFLLVSQTATVVKEWLKEHPKE
jgi:hypothetical protein